MKSKKPVKRLYKYLRAVGILSSLAAAVSALICYIGGWLDWVGYSNTLMFAGCFFFAVGGLSFLGHLNMKMNFQYQYARTAGVENYDKRTGNESQAYESSYKFLIIMVCTGVTTLILGFITALLGNL